MELKLKIPKKTHTEKINFSSLPSSLIFPMDNLLGFGLSFYLQKRFLLKIRLGRAVPLLVECFCRMHKILGLDPYQLSLTEHGTAHL